MFARCGSIAALLIAALALSKAHAQEKTQPLTGAREQAARAFVEQLGKGEFAQATQNFDAAMLKVLPADELKKQWEQVLGELGAFKRVIATRAKSKDNQVGVFRNSVAKPEAHA